MADRLTITRRDFLNGVALGVAAGSSLSPLELLAQQAGGAGYYPPSLTGLRGSHAGSFEIAHALALGGARFDTPQQQTDSTYDLVVVGGGISGLAAAVFYQQQHGGGKRVLVHEILSIQVLTAALFGGLAIASLYFGGQWVLQDNYSRWALQWTEELNELAAPLYLDDDSEARYRLESFVERYPEIDRVSYYGKDGSALFSVGVDEERETVGDLDKSRLDDAIEVIGHKKPYIMDSGLLNPRQFEILAPVWTETMAEDDLFAFDAESAAAEAQTQLLGFVGIHLDFIRFPLALPIVPGSRFDGLDFSEHPRLQPAEHGPCRCSDFGYLDSQGEVQDPHEGNLA